MSKKLNLADPTVSAGTPAGANPTTGDLTFEIWENQRHVAFKGWGYSRLPVDRPNWSNKKGDATLHTESTLLPLGMEWAGPWFVADHGEEGWYYAADYTIPTRFCSTKSNPLSLVRRRKWVRTCRPLPNLSSESAVSASPTTRGGSSPVQVQQLGKAEAAKTNHTFWSGVESYGFPGQTVEEAREEQARQHMAFGILTPYSVNALTQKLPRAAESASPPNEEADFTEDGQPTPSSPFTEVEDGDWAPRLKSSSSVSQCIYKYGVPNVMRVMLWPRWSGASQLRQRNSDYFATLSNQAGLITEGEAYQEIVQDVVRTAPKHPYFDGRGSAGSLRLTNVLLSLSLHQPHGAPPYHQAFSYIVAVLLLNMGPEDAFWTMNCLLDRLLPPGYHEKYLLQYDLRIVTELLRECFPDLDACMERNQIDVGVFASGWLQGLFCAHFPFPCASRVLDVMLFEGNSSILVRMVIAFIKLNQDYIRECDGSGTLGQFANSFARNATSIDQVIAAAMNDGLTARVLARRAELIDIANQMANTHKSQDNLLASTAGGRN